MLMMNLAGRLCMVLVLVSAGNWARAATVTAKSGSVTVLLQHEDAVQITDGDGDQIVIAGNSGTLVNGEDQVSVPLTRHLTLKGDKGASFFVDLLGLTIPGDVVCQGMGDELLANMAHCNIGGRARVTMKGTSCQFLLSTSTVTRDIQAKLGPGDSTALLAQTTTGGNVTVTTGTGDDTVVLSQLDLGGKLTLATGSGEDAVFANIVESGAFSLKQGNGLLQWSMQQSLIHGSCTVAGGAGQCQGGFAFAEVEGALKTTFGPGNTVLSANTLEVGGKSSFAFKQDKLADTGVAVSIMNSTFAADCKLTGTASADVIQFNANTHQSGKLDLRGLAGDDVFTFTGNTLHGTSARLDGGAGEDTLDGGHDALTVVNVETVESE